MDLSTLNVFRVATVKMGWLSERQGVLAQNIANADTPDYRAKDLKAPSFSKIMSNGNHNVKMVQTAKGHMIGLCLLYTSPSPRDRQKSRMPSSA